MWYLAHAEADITVVAVPGTRGRFESEGGPCFVREQVCESKIVSKLSSLGPNPDPAVWTRVEPRKFGTANTTGIYSGAESHDIWTQIFLHYKTKFTEPAGYERAKSMSSGNVPEGGW